MINRFLVQQQQQLQNQQRRREANFGSKYRGSNLTGMMAAQEIDDNDDRWYEEVSQQVARQQDESVRSITAEMVRKLKLEPLRGPSVQNILSEFKCTICQDLVNEPMVIKHCLHFFCKNCIDKQVLNFRKECPLCKMQLRTKRETRFYDKLRKIMQLMNTEIKLNRESQGEQFQDALGLWKEKQERQGQELEKRRSLGFDSNPNLAQGDVTMQEQISAAAPQPRDSKQSHQKAITEVEVISDDGGEDNIPEGYMSQMERLGEGDQFEDEDEVRIREVAERLKQNQLKQRRIQESQHQLSNSRQHSSIEAQQQSGQISKMRVQGAVPLTPDELLQRDFSRLYHKLQSQEQLNPSQPKMPKQLKPMDLNIKMIFDEDLKSMLFPKVQEIEFRVSKASPFEMAAKLLATQNGHMSEWSKYEFAFCKSTMGGKDNKQAMSSHEIEIKDWRSKTFGEAVQATRYGQDETQNFTLFYKIGGLAEILDAQNIALQQQQL